MHGGHHKESNTQHQTPIYSNAYDTSTLVMPSQTSNGRHVVFSHDNLRQQQKENARWSNTAHILQIKKIQTQFSI